MSSSYTSFDAPPPPDAESTVSDATIPSRRNTTLPVPMEPDEPETAQLRPRVHDLVRTNLGQLVIRVQEMAACRPAPRATAAELGAGIPVLFERLLQELQRGAGDAGVITTESEWHDLSRLGLGVTQVIHDYVEVHRAVAELAAEANPWIARSELAALDRCLGNAIARTAGDYSRRREQAIAEDAAERIGSLAHEFRNRLSTAGLAFELLEHEGIMRGRAAAILHRSLTTMTEHVDRAFAEVRRGVISLERENISISDLVEDIALVASVDARARGLELSVTLPEETVEVEGDRLLLGDAVLNLVKNAFKFTRASGRVQLSTHASPDRVFIEVADECGGLPDKVEHETLFERFEQRAGDRSGLGLGLAISRRGIEASGGNIGVRNRPGVGCVFAIDLPRRSL